MGENPHLGPLTVRCNPGAKGKRRWRRGGWGIFSGLFVQRRSSRSSSSSGGFLAVSARGAVELVLPRLPHDGSSRRRSPTSAAATTGPADLRAPWPWPSPDPLALPLLFPPLLLTGGRRLRAPWCEEDKERGPRWRGLRGVGGGDVGGTTWSRRGLGKRSYVWGGEVGERAGRGEAARPRKGRKRLGFQSLLLRFYRGTRNVQNTLGSLPVLQAVE